MPASWYKQFAWNTYWILLYSSLSLSTFNSKSTFSVSIPGAFRQRYLPSSKFGTTKANFGSLRWETKASFSSTRTQRLKKITNKLKCRSPSRLSSVVIRSQAQTRYTCSIQGQVHVTCLEVYQVRVLMGRIAPQGKECRKVLTFAQLCYCWIIILIGSV